MWAGKLSLPRFLGVSWSMTDQPPSDAFPPSPRVSLPAVVVGLSLESNVQRCCFVLKVLRPGILPPFPMKPCMGDAMAYCEAAFLRAYL